MQESPKTTVGLIITMAAGVSLVVLGVFLFLGPLGFVGLFVVAAGSVFMGVAVPDLEKLCLAYDWPGRMDYLRIFPLEIFRLLRIGLVFLLYWFISSAFTGEHGTHSFFPGDADAPPKLRLAQLLLLFCCIGFVESLFRPIVRILKSRVRDNESGEETGDSITAKSAAPARQRR